MKRNLIEHAKSCLGKPIAGFCCHVHSANDRYRTYWQWQFFWHSGFLTIPIGRWDWWPELKWDYWQRSFRWLWLTFEFHGGYHYEEREDWKLKKHMATVHNMILDNVGPSNRYD